MKYKLSAMEVMRGKATTILKRMFPVMCRTLWPFVREIAQKPEEMDEVAKELYRAFNVAIEREHGGVKEKLTIIRNLICFVVQNEDAYRLRLLDFVNELDLTKLQVPFKDEELTEKSRYYGYNFKKKTNKANSVDRVET